MSFIEIEKLRHCFSNGVPGIEDIDLNIENGEFVVVAGRNGSGKTTLCRHLNGLLLPTEGTVRLDGIPVQKDLARARQMVGMVFQNADSQIVGDTVYDDVAFGPENLCLVRSEIKARVSRVMAAVGLQHLAEHSPHTLSGGEKRRLAIAGVLAMGPQILIFDEPFSNLDYPGSVQVLKQILALRQANHTILIVTHELEKVIAHADRLVVMEKGRIARNGVPAQIIGEVENFGIREPCSSRLGLGVQSWLN
ncbi:MAG: ABC transporter ATP-binding protein [Proteobacteria bacterium]|nr:ABC transporter ATP-binding protein [Pseudomonadota bacterium]